MKKILIFAAGFLCVVAVNRAQAEGMAVGFGAGQNMDPKNAIKAASLSMPVILAGQVIGDDPGALIDWVYLAGGKFSMGTDTGAGNEKPVHEVSVRSFEMAKTPVTVEQYAECVARKQCEEPATGELCTWGLPIFNAHPVNCVSWEQANQFAKFVGARLPSESEWEFAASNRGKNQKYPWGNEEATCEKAVMHGREGTGCGTGTTMSVCSKPAGNTEQGLCDMAGNISQWVQDVYHYSYEGAPADGRAWEGEGEYRVTRGGSFGNIVPGNLRSDAREHFKLDIRDHFIGFRVARSR